MIFHTDAKGYVCFHLIHRFDICAPWTGKNTINRNLNHIYKYIFYDYFLMKFTHIKCKLKSGEIIKRYRKFHQNGVHNLGPYLLFFNHWMIYQSLSFINIIVLLLSNKTNTEISAETQCEKKVNVKISRFKNAVDKTKNH